MLKLTRRGKKGVWYITGTLGGKRYRESTGTASEAHAQALLSHRQTEILDRITWGEKATALFAEAVLLYLARKGDNIRAQDAKAIDKLTDRFGPRRLAEITETDVAKFAADYYPGAGAHVLDRFIYTPLIAIYRRAARAQPPLCEMPRFQRPEKPKRAPVKFAKDDVIAKLLPHATDRLKGALLLMSFTGARAAECCRLEEVDVDWERHEALLRLTKNGEPRVLPLAGLVYEALAKLKGTPGPIFGFKTKDGLNQAIKRACRRAGLPPLSSHKVGRHAFAARLLSQGHTLMEVKEAGGWKTYGVVARVYGHLERSAVSAAVRGADTNLAQLIETAPNVVRIQAAKKK
jgi:integrase